MSLIDVLLPPACAGCGRFGGVLCRPCLEGFRRPGAAADRFIVPDPGLVAGEALLIAAAAFAYDGPIRRALAALKYTGVGRVAPILASAAAPRLRELLGVVGPATLVPVPLHPDRLHQRGYNQASLLARALGRETGRPVDEPLHRSRPTTRQHRLNRAGRLNNLRDAFAAVASSPPTVIVVDDIITTAATLEACASVLRASGATAVYGFAIAREV